MVSGPLLVIIFIISIIFIILMTAKIRMNAFYVLILAALGVGITSGMSMEEIVNVIKNGFGGTLGYIGVVIICGTTIGVLLERTGAAFSLANAILRLVGQKLVPLAMSISGFIVGIPIFCDSGFVVLSTLNKALAERSKTSMSIMAVALATGLYSIHCLIPPHPGATAAAGIIGVDLGRVIMLGLPIAILPAFVGYIWAIKIGRKFDVPAVPDVTYEQLQEKHARLPNPLHSAVPIVIPVILIALKSIGLLPGHPFGTGSFYNIVILIGDPQIALLIGVFLALTLVKSWTKDVLSTWLVDGVEKAGVILAITAAGGAFGSILKATPIGEYIGSTLATLGLGIFLPFIIAAALKTAQGSSTVAILTAAALVSPMLPSLGLASGWGPTITVLAMGAGSMVASHANDSYFWVVSRFSGLDVPTALRVYTTATIITGVTAMIVVTLVSIILL
jgi:GntP family gluconate:H+ symporter